MSERLNAGHNDIEGFQPRIFSFKEEEFPAVTDQLYDKLPDRWVGLQYGMQDPNTRERLGLVVAQSENPDIAYQETQKCLQANPDAYYTLFNTTARKNAEYKGFE